MSNMDWLKSALDSDASEGEESASSASNEGDIATVDVVSSRERNPGARDGGTAARYHQLDGESSDNEAGQVASSKDEEAELLPSALFSLSTSSRKTEDYSRVERLEIRRIEPDAGYESEDEQQQQEEITSTLSQQKDDGTEPESMKTRGNLDTMEIMQCFNTIHSGGSIRPPKQRDWFGTNIKVTDIKADDLLMDGIEKSRKYSMSKAALMEGRTQYKGPTRTLETDDGQLLTTNVLRKTSKRKHQISWLATEAQERELELLERTAQARKTKHETQMKYGW